MTQTKTALLFGATGLVGNHLLIQLLAASEYKEIKVFTRSQLPVEHPKLQNFIIDFNKMDDYKGLIKGDTLFCCIGSTIKNAGSQDAFRKIDFDIPVALARVAEVNEVLQFLVISSVGADINTTNFYLKTKGEMEIALQRYKFKNLAIMRPSMLLGQRTEFRLGESIGKKIMNIVQPLMRGKWLKYRPIAAETVAGAMIQIAKGHRFSKVYESDEIEKLGNR